MLVVYSYNTCKIFFIGFNFSNLYWIIKRKNSFLVLFNLFKCKLCKYTQHFFRKLLCRMFVSALIYIIFLKIITIYSSFKRKILLKLSWIFRAFTQKYKFSQSLRKQIAINEIFPNKIFSPEIWDASARVICWLN